MVSASRPKEMADRRVFALSYTLREMAYVLVPPKLVRISVAELREMLPGT